MHVSVVGVGSGCSTAPMPAQMKSTSSAPALRVVGRIAAARQALHAVVADVVDQRTQRELVGPGRLRPRAARAGAVQRVDEGMGHRVEEVAQHAFGLGRAVGQFARHQQRIGLALGAGAQLQHRLDEGGDDGAQTACAGRAGAGLPQQRQALVDRVAPLLEDGMEELVLGAEVVAHQRQRHARLLGNLADRHAVVAVLREQPFGRQQDGLRRSPGAAPRWAARRAHGGRERMSMCRIEGRAARLVHAYKP